MERRNQQSRSLAPAIGVDEPELGNEVASSIGKKESAAAAVVSLPPLVYVDEPELGNEGEPELGNEGEPELGNEGSHWCRRAGTRE